MESICILIYRRMDKINISYNIYMYIYMQRNVILTLKEKHIIDCQKLRKIEDIKQNNSETRTVCYILSYLGYPYRVTITKGWYEL